MPQIAITGAAGFLGRHAVAESVGRGWDVVGIDRREWIPGHEHAVVADLLSPAVTSVIARADVVIHLAARPGVRDDSPDIARLRWRDNVLATEAVATATRADAHLVVASSSSVYGGAGTTAAPHPCHEDQPLAPRGGYARSKVAAEALLAHRRGPTTIVRPFTLAGEGQRPDMALQTWLEAIATGRPISVFGSLRRRRDVTDVGQAACAIGDLVATEATGTFNLGTGTTTTLADHVEAIEATVERRADVTVVAAHAREVATTMADPNRLADAIGWHPCTDLLELVGRQWRAVQRPSPARSVAA